MWKQFLLESPILENRLLGETMIIPDIEDSAESHYDPASHFKNLTKHGVFGAGTHAQLTGYLASYQLRDYGQFIVRLLALALTNLVFDLANLVTNLGKQSLGQPCHQPDQT